MTTERQPDGVNKASPMTRDQKQLLLAPTRFQIRVHENGPRPGGETQVSQVKRQKEESK